MIIKTIAICIRELIDSYLTSKKNTTVPKIIPKKPISATKSQISSPSRIKAVNSLIKPTIPPSKTKVKNFKRTGQGGFIKNPLANQT